MKRKLVCLTAGVMLISATTTFAQTWNLAGNAGTTGTDFVGTTDNKGLKFRTNNAQRMSITSNGKVGVGSHTPVFKLDVKGGSITTDSLYRIKGVQVLNRDNANNVQVGDATAKVGIGTAAPATALDVNGVITASGGTSANWNTAFSWGDHSLAGYLTSETDPVFGASPAAGVLAGDIANWNTAFGWGDHAVAGYLTAETDPQVGANALNFVSKWDGSALVTSNITSSGTFAGVNATATVGAAQFVVGNTNASYGGMYLNSTGAVGTRKPFYGYSLSGISNTWTYLDEASSSWRVYNSGDRLTVDNQGQVGIGTTAPAYYLDIQAAAAYRALNASSSYVGSVGQIVNIERTSAPSAANDILQISVPAGSPADFQFIEADKGGSNRFQVNGDGSVGIGQSTLASARLNVDGSNVENKKLYGIYATVDSATSSSAAIYGVHELGGSNVDAKGVYGKCVANPGYGYGIYGEGGYRGVYGLASGSTYAGTVYGVFGTASGSTAGTRIGVYGTASGGSTSEANWGGYFPTKVYTTEIRVGTTNGATGYIVSVGGKVMAEEVRVELEASWPDYVFTPGYKMLSLEELESHVKQFNHLPGVPSACEVEEKGLLLGQMQSITMEKTEENTLYILELKKEIDRLNARLNELEKK